VPLSSKPDEDQESISLFSLLKDQNANYFIDTEKTNTTEKLWLVVRAMKNETKKISYELKKGDIIKLGRIQFRVKDLQTPTITKNDPNNLEMNEDIKEVNSIIVKNEEPKEKDEESSIPQ